ncbi:MAG: hypothetical protein JOZ53_21415 [Planctomycetaceae bacterium]|nr:hypothetical protein [Planctomycetaceae bacterium]
MSPQAEESNEAFLTRINAGLQSKGSPEVVQQYEKGVYLNKPFGRVEHAHEVAHVLGEGQGSARVERDKDRKQNDQFWVRLLKFNEITDDMIHNATSVMLQMRQLERDQHQEPAPAEPRSGDESVPTPTEGFVSKAAFKEVELQEKSAQLPGYAYAGGQQVNTIFEVGDGGDAKTVVIKGVRSQRDAMMEVHAQGQVAIHVDAADAMGGVRDSTRYLTTRNDQDLSQPGGPLVVEFTKEELAKVASISSMDAGPFGKRTIITSHDGRSLNLMAADVQMALKTGHDEITEPVIASEEGLSRLRTDRIG